MDKQKLKDIFLGKLSIIGYDLLRKDFSEVSKDFFKTSVPSGETCGKLSFKEIDLSKEFSRDLKEFLKIRNLSFKVYTDYILISKN